jgi:transketolase
METMVDIRDAFFDKIYELATKDENVVFMTADADAFSLRRYKQDFPDRFINVGVAEQNMVTVATGLALSGKNVFIYAILSFMTMRCYEQIKFNICSMNLPITLIGLGSGLSFEFDGPSHHGVGDIGIMRMLPEMTIYNPSSPPVAEAVAQMAYDSDSPVCVRLDKGKMDPLYNTGANFKEGLGVLREGKDVCIVSTGTMVHRALEVAEKLAEYSIDVAVLDLYRLKPVNEPLLLKYLSTYKKVASLEDNSIIGGLGSILSEIITDNQQNTQLKRIALRDEQCLRYGQKEWLHETYRIDVPSIVKQIQEWHSTD